VAPYPNTPDDATLFNAPVFPQLLATQFDGNAPKNTAVSGLPATGAMFKQFITCAFCMFNLNMYDPAPPMVVVPVDAIVIFLTTAPDSVVSIEPV
jgi:hypothetical protein